MEMVGTDPHAWRTLRQYDAFDENGDLVVLPMAAHESAAMNLHRVESHPNPAVLVVTRIGRSFYLRRLSQTSGASHGEYPRTFDLAETGMNVREWFRKMDENPDVLWELNGQSILSTGAAALETADA